MLPSTRYLTLLRIPSATFTTPKLFLGRLLNLALSRAPLHTSRLNTLNSSLQLDTAYVHERVSAWREHLSDGEAGGLMRPKLYSWTWGLHTVKGGFCWTSRNNSEVEVFFCVATTQRSPTYGLEGYLVNFCLLSGTQKPGTRETLVCKETKLEAASIPGLDCRLLFSAAQLTAKVEGNEAPISASVELCDRDGQRLSKETVLIPRGDRGRGSSAGPREPSNAFQGGGNRHRAGEEEEEGARERRYTELFHDEARRPVRMEPIGHIRSGHRERHGTPRQAALADEDGGTAELVLRPDLPPSSLGGLEGFGYVWLIADLHLNRVGNPRAAGGHWSPTVRPPPPPLKPGEGGPEAEAAGPPQQRQQRQQRRRRRQRVGVFATRAPHRPNPLGLSAVRLRGVDLASGVVRLGGVDLLDGTPVLDLKPYIPYADAFPSAPAGWLDGDS